MNVLKTTHFIKTAVSLSCLLFCIFPIFSQCNGFDYLCDRKYNEVAYLTTHNAYNSEQDSFLLPNHHFNIATQLEEGVRALMIDVYDEGGISTVYHTLSILGTAPLVDFLVDIKDFLVQNPNEVVTIILECYTTADAIEADLTTAGLMSYLYTQEKDKEWATLQTMIDANTRLVLFSDVNDASPQQSWYHYVWDFAVETPFSISSLNAFTCDWNRGNPENDLFILNHFVTNVAGVGDVAQSILANANPFFMDRVVLCQELTGKFPNFITVDFYELGDCFAVVEYLNATKMLTAIPATATSAMISPYPNPTNHMVRLTQEGLLKSSIQVLTVTGQLVTSQIPIKTIANGELELDFSAANQGIYFIQTNGAIAKVIRF